MFGVQALVNLAVALAILPTKGLTLPFVSFGGSSLLVNAVGGGHPAQHLAPARDEPRAQLAPMDATPTRRRSSKRDAVDADEARRSRDVTRA